MYIKSITVDGFKSYGKRVEIGPFDHEFNAITGLNGTGKSNILDSICFVLGITNLSHVRAGSLQELIFKNGTAGITKAVVSLIFDNTDPNNSPPGYEAHKEITITRQVQMCGKNKYWINGVNVPNKRVYDLFCAVQLNVNNPHFLIMQGRVTKVLNMKAKEILAMIEESAGTRSYETKKQLTQKILEKKEVKLQELTNVISEDIMPRLEKLRSERQNYYDFLRVEGELTNFRNIFQAFLFHASERNTTVALKKYENSKTKTAEIEGQIEENLTTIENLAAEIEELRQQADENSDLALKTIEKEVKEKESSNAKIVAKLNGIKDNVSLEEKNIKQLEKNKKSEEELLDKKNQDLNNVQKFFETLREKDANDNEAFELAQKKFEALSAGMEITETGQAQTLQEQLINATKEASERNVEVKVSAKELDYLKKTLQKKESQLKSVSVDAYEKAKNNYEKTKVEVEKIKESLEKLQFSENTFADMKNQHENFEGHMRQCRDKIENFEARRPYTKFTYTPFSDNFDDRNVHGVVCRLFKLKDEKYATAIATAAGSKLYNVVVSNATTSKLLLARGKLQNRTTFIPLDKIEARRIDARTVKEAVNLVGPENVVPAIDVIEYDPKLQKAIDFVFGGVFICPDLRAAQKVTYHPKIMRRCVTLDGDETDPGGVLNGGAVSQTTPVLLQLAEILEMEEQVRELLRKRERSDNEYRQQMRKETQFRTMQQEFELKQHQLATYDDLQKASSYHQNLQEVQTLKESIETLTARVEECKKIEKSSLEKIKELEKNLEDSGGHMEKKLKAAGEEMKKLKKQAENSRKEWELRKDEYERLNFEISELKSNIENLIAQIESVRANVQKLQAEYAELEADYKEKEQELILIQEELNAEKASLLAKNKGIQQRTEKMEQLTSQNEEHKLQIQKQEHELRKLHEDYENAAAKQREFTKRTKKMDESVLKKAESMSDKDGVDLQNRIAKAEETKTKLGRGVNANAQSLFETEEKQYDDMMKKKKVVEKDKKNLLDTMHQLDKEQRNALTAAYQQVKKDFGSIFSTLLPGTNATLQPPQGKTILDGLEIKVSLGGVWKENLAELSGGQRSLAALALILAMLLFNPAPLYILDEVDAALDLSHTQNIGVMLKDHFKHSQFIVVSLKDGMFTNANVLFRTQLIDGMSSVSRTVNTKYRTA